MKFETGSIVLISGNRKHIRCLEKGLPEISPTANIVRADNVEQCLDLLSGEQAEIIMADYSFLRSEENFIDEMKKRNLYTPVVALIGEGHDRDAAEAIKGGAHDYMIECDDCIEALTRVFRRFQTMSILKKEREDELEQKSLLFRQIYRSQKWWQNIIDAITDYIFVIDDEYRVLRTNKPFADLFEKEPADIIMKPYYELFGRTEPHEWSARSGGTESCTQRSVERTIDDVDYLISCYPIVHDEYEASVFIMKDITETRRLKDQIYHLDKLSSLGTLTSGVAHEINNPLTGIIGYTEMLLMKEEDEKKKKYMQNVYDSAIRCKRIVENMLTFSRQTPSQKSIERINDIIDKTIELHEYWLKSTNIEIIREYEEVPSLHVDHQQMQQVILNMLINAEHAISDTERRGRITFRTHFDEGQKMTTIEVSDNGKGIPQEALTKIFDPFFTTKPVNKGTGLGLSIAHGIIAEQGGNIEVKSSVGEGTSFVIKLPQMV